MPNYQWGENRTVGGKPPLARKPTWAETYALPYMATALEKRKTDVDMQQKQLMQAFPSLIAANMAQPSPTGTTQYGGTKWDITAPTQDWGALLSEAKTMQTYQGIANAPAMGAAKIMSSPAFPFIRAEKGETQEEAVYRVLNTLTGYLSGGQAPGKVSPFGKGKYPRPNNVPQNVWNKATDAQKAEYYEQAGQ